MLDAFYPGFSHRPRSVTGDSHTIDVEGHRALFLHSPALLTFEPGPGTYAVSGEVGIVANAFTSDGCSAGDGVEINVSGSTGAALVYAYNPFADAALRPSRRFELGPVDVAADGVMRLDVTPGLANNGDCDWAYLRDVQIHAR